MGKYTQDAEYLRGKVDALHEDVTELQKKMDIILSDFYQRQGAMALIKVAVTAMGGAIVWILTKLYGGM